MEAAREVALEHPGVQAGDECPLRTRASLCATLIISPILDVPEADARSTTDADVPADSKRFTFASSAWSLSTSASRLPIFPSNSMMRPVAAMAHIEFSAKYMLSP